MKKEITTIATIAIAIIVVLFVAKLLFMPTTGMRTITQTGTAEMTADPDEAQMYLGISILKDTADLAASEAKTKSAAVIDAIKKIEGTTVETTNYNIYEEKDWTDKGSVSKGFRASYDLKVTTANFDDVGKIIDAAVNNGANNVNSVQFTLSKTAEEKVRAEALKQAGANAKIKAEAAAEGLGVILGSIVGVSESGFYPRPYYDTKLVAAVQEGASTSNLAIEPTSIDVSASITVTYKLK
ncbi:SIMPL domain-containing protein [Candidatus Woesearchaeota archaeon]|nr:SIMPL domain-containing protein [Candidatus Woesearchaeota archaeon]